MLKKFKNYWKRLGKNRTMVEYILVIHYKVFISYSTNWLKIFTYGLHSTQTKLSLVLRRLFNKIWFRCRSVHKTKSKKLDKHFELQLTKAQSYRYANRLNIIHIKNNKQKLKQQLYEPTSTYNSHSIFTACHQHQQEFVCTQTHIH